MSQITFDGDTTPALADLDSNFSQLFTLFSQWYQSSLTMGLFATPTLTTDGSYAVLQLNGGGALASLAPNFTLLTANFGGTPAVPTRIGAFPASYYLQLSGAHVWNTAATGAVGSSITWTEVARLTPAGQSLLGTSAQWAGYLSRSAIYYAGTTSELGLTINTPATTGTAINFLQGGNASGGGTLTQVGKITITTTATTYGTSSDYRLKDSPTPIDSASSGAFIDALNPVSFTWKLNGTLGRGFIAHELQAVSPTSVNGDKDAVLALGVVTDAAQNVIAEGVPMPSPMPEGHHWQQTSTMPDYQSVDYGSSEVIAMLVAEVKFLRARVAALEGV